MELNGADTSWVRAAGWSSARALPLGVLNIPLSAVWLCQPLCSTWPLPPPHHHPPLPQLSAAAERMRGIFNPVKPLLLIAADRTSSLPAMPAADWLLLLLFLFGHATSACPISRAFLTLPVLGCLPQRSASCLNKMSSAHSPPRHAKSFPRHLLLVQKCH